MSSYFCAIHPLGELFSCRPFNCPIRVSLWRVIFVSSIPWASYFRADHLILHPLASYFNVYHITLHPSIPMSSYFCAIHPLGELCSCRPFNCPIRLSLWRVIFASSIPWASYFRADHLILHPLVSYFNVHHITLHPSISLASYFCAIYPLGKLFSCRPFNFQVFGELFSCRPYNSPLIHPFSELFLCRPSFGQAIFMPII